MRKTLIALALAALSAASFAGSRDRVAGSYHLVPSDSTQKFCRRHHIDLPTGRLVLREDRTFRLTYTDDEGVERTSGTYEFEGDDVRFLIDTGFGVGLPRSMRADDRGLCTDQVAYVCDDEAPAPRPREIVRPREQPRPRVDPRYEVGRHSGSVEGTWRLTRGNGIDSGTKFTFNSDGTFRYTGNNSSSRGRWEMTDGGIELTWSEIDGEPVDRDAHIHKCLPFSYDGTAFYVDDYRYERR